MLTPIQILRELASKKKYISSKEEAIELFDSQVGAIQAIRDTPGFKEIQLYLYRTWEAAQTRLSTIESNNVADHKSVEAEMKQAKSMIDFLDNLSNYQIPKPE